LKSFIDRYFSPESIQCSDNQNKQKSSIKKSPGKLPGDYSGTCVQTRLTLSLLTATLLTTTWLTALLATLLAGLLILLAGFLLATLLTAALVLTALLAGALVLVAHWELLLSGIIPHQRERPGKALVPEGSGICDDQALTEING
jgi:hypothetical protein